MIDERIHQEKEEADSRLESFIHQSFSDGLPHLERSLIMLTPLVKQSTMTQSLEFASGRGKLKRPVKIMDDLNAYLEDPEAV